MMWQKSLYYPTIIIAFYFVGFGAFIIAFLLQYSGLYFVGVCLIVFAYVPKWYVTYLSRHISFANGKQKVKLMCGETGQLKFTLMNSTKIPLFFGRCRMVVDDSVTFERAEGKGKTFLTDFSLRSGEAIRLEVPITASKRGIAKIRTFEVTIRDPFNLISLSLIYNFFVKTEVVVYPVPIAISGLNNIMLMIEGKMPMSSSIYQDQTAPVGTRDYNYNDPFKHIHWKASARTGQLQTKTFENVIGMTWTIVLLIDPGHQQHITSEAFERRLSIAAFIMQFAEKHGVPYDIFFNIKSKGSSEVVTLPVGDGVQQLIKAWELLSFIQLGHIKTKLHAALAEIDKSFSERRVIMLLHTGSEKEGTPFYQKWLKRGHLIYSLQGQKESTVLMPLKLRGEGIAN